jgi:hypothetical protein
MNTYVIVVEARPEQNFIVYHIEYSRELLINHNEYIFFQDMLKSNIRYTISVFLQKMLELGWDIIGQSQNKTSIYYTMRLVENTALRAPQIKGGGSSLGKPNQTASSQVASRK